MKFWDKLNIKNKKAFQNFGPESACCIYPAFMPALYNIEFISLIEWWSFVFENKS
jgi:hypothetical protein